MNRLQRLGFLLLAGIPTAAAETSPEAITAAPAEAALQLDTVQISGQPEPLAEISTKKLLRVPGAGYDPLRAYWQPARCYFYQRHGVRACRAWFITQRQRLLRGFPAGRVYFSQRFLQHYQ